MGAQSLAWSSPRAWAIAACLGGLVGCTNPNATPPAEGSWVEILEMEVSPDALAVEDLPEFRTVDIRPDRLVFTFDGASPLRVDHVVGATREENQVYLRRIVELNTLADGRVEALTQPASIHEFYPKLRFIVHYRPRRGVTSTEAEGDVGGARMGSTEECTPDTAPCNLAAGTSVDGSTAGCTTSSGSDLTLEPIIEADLTADFEFDHGISVGWTSLKFEPDAVMHLDGKVRTGVRFHAASSATLSCDADFAGALFGGEAPDILLAGGVVPGLLPIPWAIKAKPIFGGTLTAHADAGQLSAHAWAEATADAEFGIRDRDEVVFEQRFGTHSEAAVTTARAGSFSAHGEITAGVQIKLTAGWEGGFDEYGVRGQAALQGEAHMTLTGTIGVNIQTEDAGCGWSAEVPWTADAKFGAKFDASGSAGLSGLGGSVDFDLPSWTPEETWEAEVFSGTLGEWAGPFPWCEMSAEECGEGAAFCHDDAYDNQVCAGMRGYRACDGTWQVQRCTCTADGWVDCGTCVMLGG